MGILNKIFKKDSLGKYRKLNPKKVKRYLLTGIGAFMIITILLFAWYAKDLPTPGAIKNRKPAESSQILDRNGKVLYDVHGDENRTILKSEEIPISIKQATVAAEDKNFYKHFGVDAKGLVRAVVTNIFQGDLVAQGGSTITQQFVKNALLTTKKTMDRKIKELILSLEIETMYSKDEILTFYLNEIPYGGTTYGVEAASQYYFGKTAKELKLEESAMLAAMAQLPTYYSPYGQHPDKLKARRDYVLDNMVELKYITKEQAEETKTKKIEVVEPKENIEAAHFVMYAKSVLVDMYGEQAVMQDGLKVTTTLDLDLQKKAEEAVKKGYEQNKSLGASNAALVSLDPKTGQILSMVGSHDYFDQEHDGQVNVTISERQPGSSFKPIAYATAFKGKYSPSSILWDVKTDFGNYTPANYDGRTHGPVTVRYALANSLNIPAVKILYLAGIDNVIKTAHEMGITSLNNPEQYGLSLVLGGGEVKPLDMATAYGVFANKGVLAKTTPFLKIEDKNGKILYEYNEGKNKKEVLDPQIAYEISHVLSDNEARSSVFGTRSALYFADRPVAAKTGTTDSYKDAWTIGYTPSLVTAVWVGNNNNTPMKAGGAGAMAAAPIFHNYMASALAGKQVEQFERPSGIQDFTVDKLSGKIPNDQSPDKITDIFASWQVPKEHDDIHVKVKVCKICPETSLADENCPEGRTEYKTYTNIHSEVPNNPNWENPVIAAARAMGLSIGEPPKNVCSLSSLKPSISITSPSNNEVVSGKMTISTNTQAPAGIKEVVFYIDNVQIGSTDKSPYSFTYSTNKISSANHTLMAKLIDNNDLEATSTITINVIADAKEPDNVKNVSLTPGQKSITVSWLNPSDKDLEKAIIYISTSNGTLGVKNKEIDVSSNETSTYTIKNLDSNKTYYITIKTQDEAGNISQNPTQYDTKTL